MGGTTALKSDLPTTSLGLLLAFHALPLETVPKNVLDSLRKKGSVTILQNNCVLETSRQLAEQLELFPGTKAILLTRFSAIASAVCNRKTALRALVGEDPARMEDDAKSLGANLLILDPERSGFFRTRQMMERFISLGPAACPSNIRKGLLS